MKKFLQILKEAFISLLNEPIYVTSALIGGKVTLPRNYWRFWMLYPLWPDDINSIKTTAFGKNYCPLFWASNLALLLYLTVGPLVLLIMGVMHLGSAAKIKIAKCNVKVKTRQCVNTFDSSDIAAGAVISERLKKDYSARLQAGLDYETGPFYIENIDTDIVQGYIESLAEKRPALLRKELEYKFRNSSTLDYEGISLKFLYAYEQFKLKHGDNWPEELEKLKEAERKQREIWEQLDKERGLALATASKLKAARVAKRAAYVAALTPKVKKTAEIAILTASIVGALILLVKASVYVPFVLGAIWKALVFLFNGVVEIGQEFLLIVLNIRLWGIAIGGLLGLYLAMVWLQKLIDLLIDKGMEQAEMMAARDRKLAQLKQADAAQQPPAENEQLYVSKLLAELAPILKGEQFIGQVFCILGFLAVNLIGEPCIWFYNRVLIPIWSWIVLPFSLVKMTLTNHCPKIEIDESSDKSDSEAGVST